MVNLKPKDLIKREGSEITTQNVPFLLDVVGRYTVTIGGKSYDCLCVIDVETYNTGVLSEQLMESNISTGMIALLIISCDNERRVSTSKTIRYNCYFLFHKVDTLVYRFANN